MKFAKHIEPGALAFDEEVYVFRKGSEYATGEELGDLFGGVAIALEAPGEVSKFDSDGPGNPGGATGWVEGEWVLPDSAKTGLDFWSGEVC